MDYLYFADYRSMLNDKNTLVVHVASNPNYMENVRYKAIVDGKECDVLMVVRDTIRARFCYTVKNIFFTCEYQFLIKVPDKFKNAKLTIMLNSQFNNYEKSITIKGSRYRKMNSRVPGSIDLVKKEQNGTRVIGWSADCDRVDIYAEYKGEKLDADVVRPFRKDIADYYLDGEVNYAAGFEFLFDETKYDKVKIVCSSNGKTTIHPVSLTNIKSKKNFLADAIRRASNYRKKYGFGIMVQKIFQKLMGTNVYEYNSYIRTIQAGEEELNRQKKVEFDKKPLFSIVVPVYRPDRQFFEEMINSVKEQTYANWELCLADGSGDGYEMDTVCDRILKSDSRIKYKKIEKNYGISGNTNEAIKMATGDYIVLGDHDDLFRPDALFECAKLINEHDDVEVIYTDEDKYDCGKKKRIDPNFKPDLNLYMLRSGNYICHMFVFSRAIHEKVGMFRSEYDGAQDFDMILRCVETAKKVYHIPKILYTWRCHENSTALNPESKKYAYYAGKNAVAAHLERMNIKADVTIDENHAGIYKIKYELTHKPKVSIIIPNMNHTDDLDKCIRSIEKQDYDNIEIVIVENNSNEETFSYYDSIQKEFDNIVVVKWEEKGFNYSKINNFGIKAAKGEYVLLLNNDTEMIKEDCISQMVSFAIQPDVGIVGAKLLYGDNTVQHVGVVLGFGGVAGHAFVGINDEYGGYQLYTLIPREYSAVTAACLMVKKSLYEEVGGLDEVNFAVAFNDVDFCLKVREKGKLVVYNPDAVLYHYESKSRGYEDTPEKISRFQEECNSMVNKWNKIITDGDPYYNPNLTLTKADFSLREL